MHGQKPAERKIEVWARSFAPGIGAKRDRTLARAAKLARTRESVTVEVDTWGSAVELGFDDSGVTSMGEHVETAADRAAEFWQWAESNEYTIEPYFSRRRVESRILEESYEVIRLPTVAVAEYESSDLVRVAPSADPAGRTIEPGDLLADLLDDRRVDVTGSELAFESANVSGPTREPAESNDEDPSDRTLADRPPTS